MKYVKIELADQTYEKLEQYHAKYVAERKLAAEDYEQRGDFDLSESLAKDFSLEEISILEKPIARNKPCILKKFKMFHSFFILLEVLSY